MRSTITAEKVADAAAAVEEDAPLNSRAYAYAAGVEDALRWVLELCSPNVFSGLTGVDADGKRLLATLTEAGEG